MSAQCAMRPAAGLLIALAASGVVLAQTSASYKLTEFTFNNGGDPTNGSSAASASYRIRLDAIGDAVTATALSSASHRVDARRDAFVRAGVLLSRHGQEPSRGHWDERVCEHGHRKSQRSAVPVAYLPSSYRYSTNDMAAPSNPSILGLADSTT